jgi:hypothetical protein
MTLRGTIIALKNPKDSPCDLGTQSLFVLLFPSSFHH